MFTRKRVIGALIALILLAAVAIGGYHAGAADVNKTEPPATEVQRLESDWMFDPTKVTPFKHRWVKATCPDGQLGDVVGANSTPYLQTGGYRPTATAEATFDEKGLTSSVTIELQGQNIDRIILVEYVPDITGHGNGSEYWAFEFLRVPDRTSKVRIEQGEYPFAFTAGDRFMVCTE